MKTVVAIKHVCPRIDVDSGDKIYVSKIMQKHTETTFNKET